MNLLLAVMISGLIGWMSAVILLSLFAYFGIKLKGQRLRILLLVYGIGIGFFVTTWLLYSPKNTSNSSDAKAL